MKEVSGGDRHAELLKKFIKMSKKYINVHSVRYHRPTDNCSPQQNQWNSKLFTHIHMHTTHVAHTNTHTSQRKRPKDKPPTLEKTRTPSHHRGGVGAGQVSKRAKDRNHKLRPCPPPKKKLHPQHPPTKENYFVTWMTKDVLWYF